MKALRPEWQVGLLTSAALGNLSNSEADFLAVNIGLATRFFVHAVHIKGKQVFVWTVNDAATMFTSAGRGADGLITDKPAMARIVLPHRANMPVIGRLILEFAEILGVFPELGEQ
nr:glycerophosphodiester phosphodiesterase family protein [Methyloprofundus sp.]